MARGQEQGRHGGRVVPTEGPDDDLCRLLAGLQALYTGDFGVRLRLRGAGVSQEIAEVFNNLARRSQRITQKCVHAGDLVGRQGRIGKRVAVDDVPGSWNTIMSAQNTVVTDLVQTIGEISRVIHAVANGDLSQGMPTEIAGRTIKGDLVRVSRTINTMVDQLRSFAAEVTRVAKEVGIDGKLGGQARVKGVSGIWKDLTDNVNQLTGNLTNQVRNIALVTTAVAKGDLSQKITVDARGEILALKDTINTMVDQLRSFAAEVTRVAKEVGIDGKLGGQARVKGVSGTWKDLTDNVNGLAGNLTSQVRNIALVTTAVAKGDLSQKITVDARGEILELKNIVNAMVDQLRSFAAEVARVAKEVGIDGKLGGQARVSGVGGTWKDVTDNVNQLAGNLTSQVRAIAEVSTAVTNGDLTRSVTVEAKGEVLALKDNINKMIRNLKETTEKNWEQDWLKTNLARFSAMMQGQKNLSAVSRLIMSELTPLVAAQHGVFYAVNIDGNCLNLTATYACTNRPMSFSFGEGLVGQCALEKQKILLTVVPEGYICVTSGLGHAPPASILVLPVLFEGDVLAVIELASLQVFSPINHIFLDQLMISIGVILNIINASARTEELLKELQNSNIELEVQAKELEEKATLLEIKNQEVEMASLSLEEKAQQLSMISQYKSEFLANMSHELRTPLNSLLIMAKLLSDNGDKNLSPKQIQFSHNIYASGRDLLSLINEILDLAKVEAGKMELLSYNTALLEVVGNAARDFYAIAQQKEITFTIECAPDLPQSIYTDSQRLQQIIKNLLSNAFKFTEIGHITLKIRRYIDDRAKFQNEALREADTLLEFSVEDTGIGIAEDQKKLIFEAFQQVDATTNRKYGGTGLGLTISRELSRLLGGEIHLRSVIGKGSEFTLYLPVVSTDADHDVVIFPTASVSCIDIHTEPSAAETAEFCGETVLVVDDDVRNIYALSSVLENHKINVVFAESGADAVDIMANRNDVALVLMDIMMPGMDGYEATQAIHDIGHYRQLPIIALTAKAMKGDREKALEVGLSDYITKPADTNALLQVVGRWIVRKQHA
ncbi:MAG: HAMP domain-containing protein [Acidiferrobacter sp.]